MKVVVIGASGMLGKRVVKEAKSRNHEVFQPAIRLGGNWPVESIYGDVIINCAGIVPSKHVPPTEILTVNSIGPWQLASAARYHGIRLIHMSTDCVFSGRHELLRSDSIPDPIDLYGRSKLAGEPWGENILSVRGSFIGQDHGFLYWLLNAKDSVDAWTAATWNGGSAKIMASALVDLAEGEIVGVAHVAADAPVTKAWMVEYLVDQLDLPIGTIRLEKFPRIRRALVPDIVLPSVKESLDGLVKEIRDDDRNS